MGQGNNEILIDVPCSSYYLLTIIRELNYDRKYIVKYLYIIFSSSSLFRGKSWFLTSAPVIVFLLCQFGGLYLLVLVKLSNVCLFFFHFLFMKYGNCEVLLETVLSYTLCWLWDDEANCGLIDLGIYVLLALMMRSCSCIWSIPINRNT